MARTKEHYSTTYGCKATPYLRSQNPFTKVRQISRSSVTHRSPFAVETQLQNVLSTFSISSSLSPSERLDKLRSIPAQTLVSRIFDLDIHTFRGVTDDAMIPSDLITNIHSGAFAARFKARGMRILLGEAETEEILYALTNPPPDFSHAEMLKALNNYYAEPVCEALLGLYKDEGGAADARVEAALALGDEKEKAKRLFGLITSDVQVRAPIRVLSKALFDGGVPAERILRYRVAFRPECTDKVYPKSFGVTHACDGVSWWYIERYGFSEAEKENVKKWLGKTLIPLVAGDGDCEEKLGAEEFLYFKGCGDVDVVKDQHWKWLSRVAKTFG
jgi:carboxylesterase type B